MILSGKSLRHVAVSLLYRESSSHRLSASAACPTRDLLARPLCGVDASITERVSTAVWHRGRHSLRSSSSSDAPHAATTASVRRRCPRLAASSTAWEGLNNGMLSSPQTGACFDSRRQPPRRFFSRSTKLEGQRGGTEHNFDGAPLNDETTVDATAAPLSELSESDLELAIRAAASPEADGATDGRVGQDGFADVPGASKGGKKLAIVYTCKVCSTRSAKRFTERAYNHGVVLVRCPGCQNLHLIADRLGFFEDVGEDGAGWDVQKAMAKMGEKVVAVTDDNVLELTMADVLGSKLADKAAAAVVASGGEGSTVDDSRGNDDTVTENASVSAKKPHGDDANKAESGSDSDIGEGRSRS